MSPEKNLHGFDSQWKYGLINVIEMAGSAKELVATLTLASPLGYEKRTLSETVSGLVLARIMSSVRKPLPLFQSPQSKDPSIASEISKLIVVQITENDSHKLSFSVPKTRSADSTGAEEAGSRRSSSRQSGSRPNSRGSVRPSSRGSVRPSSRGSVRPSSRGSVRPSSRGSLRPSSRGSVRPVLVVALA